MLGTLTVLVVFVIGRALGGFWTGVLSAFFMAVCAGHIQQSHYYTVDVSLTFWVSVALYLAIEMPSERLWRYIAFGAVIGLATGTRLVGVWLGVPFVLAHVIPSGPLLEKGVPRWLLEFPPCSSREASRDRLLAVLVGAFSAMTPEDATTKTRPFGKGTWASKSVGAYE